jgi:hypothetical protein
MTTIHSLAILLFVFAMGSLCVRSFNTTYINLDANIKAGRKWYIILYRLVIDQSTPFLSFVFAVEGMLYFLAQQDTVQFIVRTYLESNGR